MTKSNCSLGDHLVDVRQDERRLKASFLDGLLRKPDALVSPVNTCDSPAQLREQEDVLCGAAAEIKSRAWAETADFRTHDLVGYIDIVRVLGELGVPERCIVHA